MINEFRTNAISLVGLGKLGLPLAAVFAKSGLFTIGIDINTKVIESVNSGKSPIVEKGLDEIIAEVGGDTLIATGDFNRAIDQTDITYVLTATPSKSDGGFSNEQVESALIQLSQCLKNSKKSKHLFVISSTVIPGSIDNSFIPIIEEYSGRTLNEGFYVAYCPDFVALGDVVNGFLNPEIVVIGQSIEKAGEIVEQVHHRITSNSPSINRMSLASAEIAKVSLNAYITMKISFANNLANICELWPTSDVDDVTSSIGLDKRISPYYFKGGMSFGGTCFPRDTYAFNHLSKKVGLSTELFDSITKINEYQDQHLRDIVLNELENTKHKRVTILGMSFKVGTPVIEKSVGLKLVNNLLNHNSNIKINVVDPMAINNCKEVFKEKIEYSTKTAESLLLTDVIVLINNEEKFIQSINSINPCDEVTIVDCWRLLKKEEMKAKVKLIQWGKYQGVKK